MSLIPKIGDNFSGCQILARCGNGAFGITFLAQNPLGQKVIIKIISSPRSCEREIVGLRNYMLVAGKHPNLLQIYHIGETEDGFYYTMEAADNCSTDDCYYPATLGNFFRQGRIFTPEESLAITRELLSAVKVMHQANLIHRDIKPDNIIFVNGRAKLSDPGLVVEVGQSASFAGTVGFIPPEMLANESPADQASDLYALGKVFYCMLTNQPSKSYPQLPTGMRLEVCRQLYPALSRMCNRNPEKRFKTADEFADGLPTRLLGANLWEKCRENFRAWRTLNSSLYHKLLGVTLLLILLSLLVPAGYIYNLHRQKQRAAYNKQQVEKFLSLNADRRDVIELQLETYYPEQLKKYQKLSGELADFIQNNDYTSALNRTGQLKILLAQTAQKIVPDLTAVKGKDFSARFTAAGAMHGFLSSPLAEYLDSAERKKYAQALQKFEKELYQPWSGLRCGLSHNTLQEYYLSAIFIPPGSVKMRHNQKLVRIDYPFWMSQYEIPHAHFSRALNIAPQKSPHNGTPAERITWNDLLFYCYYVSLSWQNCNLLPPGYIVRPPTEAEWEYAANNAYLGQDDAPVLERAVFRENARNRTWPGGSKKLSRLGLADMYGNVAEIVQPIEKTAMQNSVVVRGGSFREKSTAFRPRLEFLQYQNIPYDIGSRVVIAPGTMEYFDQNFFMPQPMQTVINGKVFELIGANSGALNWQIAKQHAGLLGGKLAEIKDMDELTAIRKAIPLTGSWVTFIGAQRQGKDFYWLTGGQKVDFGKFKNQLNAEKKNFLALTKHNWVTVDQEASALLLCQWDEKSYHQRNQQLLSGQKMPLELKRFTVGNRRFMLIDSCLFWHAAYRVAQLLGGNLAVLDTEEVRRKVIEELSEYQQYPIFLGGYAKRHQWFWLNGSEIKGNIGAQPKILIPSRNNNFIALYQGKLHNCQTAQFFLVEWRISSDSSH